MNPAATPAYGRASVRLLRSPELLDAADFLAIDAVDPEQGRVAREHRRAAVDAIAAKQLAAAPTAPVSPVATQADRAQPSRLQLHVLGAIAEFENARIAERVRAGLTASEGARETARTAQSEARQDRRAWRNGAFGGAGMGRVENDGREVDCGRRHS